MRFRQELHDAREAGCWTTLARLDPTFGGIAVPLIDRKGVCKSAMSMTVLAANFTLEAMRAKLLAHLREAAQMLRPLLSQSLLNPRATRPAARAGPRAGHWPGR
jgi:IclR family pca regulon transcriptional regulator